jgi:photosystem II stability/assembly factor-like uncharacterized protein
MHGNARFFVRATFICFIFLLLSLSLPFVAGQGAREAEAAPGMGWELLDLPVSQMEHITAVDAMTAYVAGGTTNPIEGVILKTTDGGLNWSVIYDMDDVHIFDIDAVDANNIWTVVLINENLYTPELKKTLAVAKSADGGGSWAVAYSVDAPYIWPYMEMSISAVDASVVWVALEKGQILRTADGGATWTTSDVGFFPSGVTYDSYACTVSAVDANVAWVTGGRMTWAKSYVDGSGSYATYPGPPYLFVLPYHPIIASTTDGGAAWAVKQQGTYDEQYSDIAAADALNAIAVGEDINYSPNPGMIIATMYLSNTPYPYFYWIVASTNAVTTTHDGGITWTYQLADYPGSVASIDMVDASTAWVAGSDGAIFKTIDGGISGYPQASGTTANIGEIDAVDPTTVWAVVRYSPATSRSAVLRTTDGGDPLPDIVSASPRSGGTGSELTLSGCDFGDSRGSSYVSFGTVPATEYVSWSDTKIVVKVPAGVVGEVKVTVTTTQGTSNGKPFTSTAPLPMPCGAGSGTAMLMLGMCLGLLSAAGSVRLCGRRRAKA